MRLILLTAILNDSRNIGCGVNGIYRSYKKKRFALPVTRLLAGSEHLGGLHRSSMRKIFQKPNKNA